MFDKNSVLSYVNILSKLIGLILFMITIIMVKNYSLLILGSFTLMMISYSKNKYLKLGITTFLLSIITTFFSFLNFPTKVLIIILYLLILKEFIKYLDLRYLIEVTLYRFNNKKITYKILYLVYFIRKLKINLSRIEDLRKDYDIKKDWYYKDFAFKQAYLKTKEDLKELMVINEFRFYNFSNQRTYIEKVVFEYWDSMYLISHILLLVFIVVYGR